MSVRVLVVDDEDLVRTGIRLILEAESDITVVGTAVDGVQALQLTADLKPDVVLMDVRMPRMDGLEATRRLLAGPESAVRVLILTTFDLDEHVYAALQAGASGFLLKDVPAVQLVHAIRVVAAGEALLAPSVTRRLISRFAAAGPLAVRADAAAMDRLTPRERDVLVLLGEGLSNSEIGRRLFIGEATVKTHVARVLVKLELRDRVQAVVFAHRCGLGSDSPRPSTT